MIDPGQCVNMLAYLHGLIDPHDPLNPKFAHVQAQIDGIVEAMSEITAMSVPAILVPIHDAQLISSSADQE